MDPTFARSLRTLWIHEHAREVLAHMDMEHGTRNGVCASRSWRLRMRGHDPIPRILMLMLMLMLIPTPTPRPQPRRTRIQTHSSRHLTVASSPGAGLRNTMFFVCGSEQCAKSPRVRTLVTGSSLTGRAKWTRRPCRHMPGDERFEEKGERRKEKGERRTRRSNKASADTSTCPHKGTRQPTRT
jgi:hypothetical protein